MKIICSPRYTEEQVYILEHIEEIVDFNILSNHILCFIHAMLSVDRDVKQDLLELSNSQTVQSQAKPTNSMNSEYHHLSGSNKVKSLLVKLSAMMKDHLADIRKSKMSFVEIKEKFGKDFSDKEIQSNLDELEDNGNIVYGSSNSQRYYEFI